MGSLVLGSSPYISSQLGSPVCRYSLYLYTSLLSILWSGHLFHVSLPSDLLLSHHLFHATSSESLIALCRVGEVNLARNKEVTAINIPSKPNTT
jgi:hypothetical protein